MKDAIHAIKQMLIEPKLGKNIIVTNKLPGNCERMAKVMSFISLV